MAQIFADIEEDSRRDPETYAIIGAAMDVHRELGHGFLERVYQEALAIELNAREIPFEMEVSIPIRYKDSKLDTVYRADFLCYGAIVLELKALSELVDAHLEQVIHYLKATGLSRALLLNFGTTKLEYKRVVYNYKNLR